MPYLKPSLPENEHVVLEMTGRLGQETGEYGPKWKYQFAWNNKPFDHDATMNEEKVLQKAMPGMTLQAKKVPNPHGKGFMIFWDILTASDVARAAANPQPAGNTRMDGDRKKLEEQKKTEEAKWERIAVSKIVHNYMLEGMKMGKEPALAAADAKEWTRIQYSTVEQLVRDLTPSDFAQDEDRSLGY